MNYCLNRISLPNQSYRYFVIVSEDDSGGHRIEHFLRNAIHTAFTVPDATLLTVYKLLTNTKFRNSVTRKPQTMIS